MEKKIFSSNRKAYYNYEILEKLETGIVLSGYEVKSVRRSNISLVDSIVRFSNSEAFVENVFIAPYEQISSHIADYDPKRKRKLLMHKSEINRMHAKVKEKGFTVIPLEVYIGGKGKVKLLIGLAKGKKSYDKKEAIKKKDIAREMAKEY
ncbi:SsrA-binding protein SmpB [Candidatus Endomicrobiellum devescovinae]|jgi:SsrA-binding protein|uniref:SsrA-binding protein SmpB n=1 Tax=Candidatus Endomicrobiellum devescovinae TaxID=3242322 RepID=UPI00283314AE|nr:SsrA-binding protein SmpB [Endomicrobium sp.]MDR1434609.1 SsrA-binding protein SmpB [Endomicrobium sp.]MDR2818843.1 SsrA-binding protein SmpB [Endomicrobium sp.]